MWRLPNGRRPGRCGSGCRHVDRSRKHSKLLKTAPAPPGRTECRKVSDQGDHTRNHRSRRCLRCTRSRRHGQGRGWCGIRGNLRIGKEAGMTTGRSHQGGSRNRPRVPLMVALIHQIQRITEGSGDLSRILRNPHKPDPGNFEPLLPPSPPPRQQECARCGRLFHPASRGARYRNDCGETGYMENQ